MSPRRNAVSEDIHTGSSMGILQGLHDFQFAGPWSNPSHVCPDTFALAIFRCVGKAVRDWADKKEDASDKVNRYFIAKIQFHGADILRFAFAAMREA